MGSYGVIKEALLVKQKGSTAEYSVVQKLVPATVNGMVLSSEHGGFVTHDGREVSIFSVYNGGSFGFSELSGSAKVELSVNIPDCGVKMFTGRTTTEVVSGVGECIMCTPLVSDPTAPYTNLCLFVESPGSVFAN